MMPGLRPTLHAPGDPLRDGQMFSSNWLPDGVAGYRCDIGVSFTGGVAPFTYQWVSEGGITITDPTANPTTARGSSGHASPATCTVRDATGAMLMIMGSIGA